MDSDRQCPRLALVIPCYNEAEVIESSLAQLDTCLGGLVARGVIHADSTMITVDDGSRDATWSLIEARRVTMPRLRGVKLSRNFGHQAALLAGLRVADADCVITIDADLQDDLGAIERMIAHYAAGAEIVYGVRDDRTEDTGFKRVTAQGFYRLMKRLGVDVVFNHADYRLMGRRAIAALGRYEEVNLFLRATVPLLGFRSATVTYARKARTAGETKYPFRKMLAFALTGVTSFSLTPLRVITTIGFVVAALAAVVGLWALVAALAGWAQAPGWASILIAVSFFGGAQLFALGVVGEYVGRIYLETKRRPRFEIETVTGDQGPSASA